MKDFGKGSHLQLIDGSGYIFRSFFMAERSLPKKNRYRSDETPIGAIHFLCNMLLSLIQRRRDDVNPPTHCAVVFDHSGDTFRHQIYPDYKAHRPPPPDDLVPQFALSREAVRAFNMACLELDGYEADDIIATLATQASAQGGEVTVVSSDKDLMQLVGHGIKMFEPMKSVDIGRDEVREKFVVDPHQVIDVQALAGDSTDNVPGAPGIGVKTAALLINEYGDLESLLSRAEEIKQPKRRQALIDHADNIRLSKQLVTLKRDVPLDVTFKDLEIADPESETLFTFLRAQEFRTIVRRAATYLKVELPAGRLEEVKKSHEADCAFDLSKYETIVDIDSLNPWIERAKECGVMALDTETDGIDEMQAQLVGISLAVDPGKACYIPLQHTTKNVLFAEQDSQTVTPPSMVDILRHLKPVLESSAVLKIGQNIKFDTKILMRHGINLAPVDDTMLMSYAMNGGQHRHSMDFLSERYLSHRPMPIKDLIGSGKSQITFDKVAVKDATRYAAEDADVTLRLWHRFRPQLHQSQVTTVYETLERPLIGILADMEFAGVKVDGKKLNSLSIQFKEQMTELQSQVFEAAGEQFNLNSPKQLGVILFERLRLPGGKRLPSGGFATGASILESLALDGHELPRLILDYRKLAKLKSTYTDALLDRVHPQTGRVHTSYLISGAHTGRLASSEPNLQNIPVRTEEGRQIREAFVAEEGHVLLSLDYSQIELRILAQMADIEPLKEAFRAGMDIHAMTASEIFGVPVEDMDPMIRRRAKAINFGVIYGISSFGLARDLQITRAEAKDFIDRYFERFPGIRRYMEETISFAQQHKFVCTMFGRRIHTPYILEKPPRRGAAERGAINAPIQGSAADIIRRAMVRIPPVIKNLPARMLLQVHDELLFEVREDAVDDVARRVSEVMATAERPAAHMSPPLVVDCGYADNWRAAH